MSRSAVDATRFTATSPHAYSKPSSLRSAASNTFSPSPIPRSHTLFKGSTKEPAPPPSPSRNPGDSVETPKQKVARLRAAHAASRAAEVSSWDKIVVRGRAIADRAHRYTAFGLIGLTVISGGVAFFALGDMIVYNRRKRKSFFAEQHMILTQKLAQAREAAATGSADEDQMLLLNRERAAEEAESARMAKKSAWKTFQSIFSTEGLKQEETGSELEILGEESLRKIGEGDPLMKPAMPLSGERGEDLKEMVLQAVEERRRDEGRELVNGGVEGGPLDAIAEHVTKATKARTQSAWSSWFSSR